MSADRPASADTPGAAQDAGRGRGSRPGEGLVSGQDFVSGQAPLSGQGFISGASPEPGLGQYLAPNQDFDIAEAVQTSLSEIEQATEVAQEAFRDTSRLIQLLTVLSSPSPAEELRQRALVAICEVFAAEVACILEAVGDGFVLASVVGIPEEDPAFVSGWRLGQSAAEALASGKPITRVIADPGSDPEVPDTLAGRGIRSVAFVSMQTQREEVQHLMAVFRTAGEPLDDGDLHMLASVARRLAWVAEDRERAVAVEHLARGGHILAQYIDQASHTSLQSAAEGLLRRLTASDDAWVVMLSGQTRPNEIPPSLRERRRPSSRPPLDPRAWEAALQGRDWSSVEPGGPPPRARLYVPVMRGGVPIALLCATRNRPLAYHSRLREAASMFATYVGTAVENARLYQELRLRATRDPLTGLANRDLASQRLSEALRSGTMPQVGLLFCDLDGFKAINDRLGHEAGDELLQQVAARLQRGLRSRDLLARFGGDEFVVVLGEIRNQSDVIDVGRRLMRAFDEPFAIDGEKVMVTASIGGVLGGRGKTSASTMLRDADAAMYAAKSRGPGEVEVFDEAASSRSLDRLGMRSDLANALERNELEVEYQPIVRLDTCVPVSFEALLRWTHPSRGPIPPDVFVPLAEEAGLIVPIGSWVFERALEQLARWNRLPGKLPGGRSLGISVNVSAAQLWQEDSFQRIMRAIRSAGVQPSDVWLEFTERSHAGHDVTHVTQALRAEGVHMSLDDFGASYANLGYLKEFSAEGLKIDRSFVDNVAYDTTNRLIVQGILAIAESLGLSVVAEGIERAADRDALVEMGCEMGQGHLFAPALSVDEATELLASWLDGSGPKSDGCQFLR